jgi:hypothetical protein
MAKTLRSPVLGYNHNLRYHGRVFHVQTEDSGPAHARLFTHLFFEGTILSSKKEQYVAEAPEETVKLSMQRLHKEMIRELTHGLHDERIASFFAVRGEPAALDDKGNAVAAPPPPAPPSADPAGGPRQTMMSGSIEVKAPPRPPSPAPSVVVTPPAVEVRGQMTQRPVVVVKPGELKRPPVVLASSADGAVVQRNVVINVGGGAPPVAGRSPRGTRPRPAVPYVVREGSYPLPPAGRAGPAAPTRTRTATAPAGERAPKEKPFSADLVSDKSLDDVILEYLSDDAETDER